MLKSVKSKLNHIPKIIAALLILLSAARESRAQNFGLKIIQVADSSSNFEKRYNMRLSCNKQKSTIQMRLFFAFATFLFTTNLFSQVKPYVAIGVVNDCHFYNGITGYRQWNGMPIFETGKNNIIGPSLNVGTVLYDKFIIGFTRSKSSTNGDLGLNHYRSNIIATGMSIIPIIAHTNKLKVGIGLNACRQKLSAIYTDKAHSIIGTSSGNLLSLAIPLWIDYKVTDKLSILGLPSYGKSRYYGDSPVWNINIGVVYDLGLIRNHQ
jgi:hypothetical protein